MVELALNAYCSTENPMMRVVSLGPKSSNVWQTLSSVFLLKICFNRIDPCVQWPSEMSQSFRWKVRCFETTMSGSSWKWGPLASFLGSSQFSTSIRSRRYTSYIVNICCQVDMQCFFKCFNIPFYSLPTLNLFILCPEFLLLPLSLIFR